MASPFDVFRRNQKVLMVLLVGLSMIAFIVADSINPQNFPIFLGAIFGGLGLWLLSGRGGGEGWGIAAAGAVLGAAVGWYGPILFGDNTAVRTDEGNLSSRDVEQILHRQDQANQFLGAAYAIVRDKLPEARQSQFREPAYFGFGDVNSVETRNQSAVLNFLFQKEADRLGIQITDEAVMGFLNDQFEDRLSRADLERAGSDIRAGTGEVVDILREQLRARAAVDLLVPRDSPTPQELWTEFVKLEGEAEVTAVAVPAEAFVAEVPEPSPQEQVAYFDRYKDVESPSKGVPGFRVPRQFQVAYVEIDMAGVRKTVSPPTDAEVLAFYEANRSRFEFAEPSNAKPTGDAAPVEAPKPGPAAAPAGPASTEPASEPAPETPTSETPAEGAAAEPAATPPTETPPAEEAAPPGETTPPGESSSAVDVPGEEFVAFQPTSDPGATAGDAGPGAEGASPTPPAFPPAPAKPAPAAPSAETLAAVRQNLINQRARQAADERLKTVREDIDRIVGDITESVLPPEDPRDPEAARKYEQDRLAAVKKVVAAVKAYAAKNGLRFQTTGYLSAAELLESSDYAIGQAVLWQADRPFTASDMTNVTQQVFLSAPDQPLTTIAAQSLLNDSRYVALKIADVPPREPKLDEPAVKERVVEAWKLEQARDLAKKRAEALAKADDGKRDLAEAIKGQTVTGKAGGQELTARNVGPFSRLRRSTVPGAGFAMPEIVPTTLPELPGAGEKFMTAVFEKIGVGSTGVAAADDGSAFYVVEVDARTSGDELAKLRDKFIKEDFFFFLSPFRARMAEETQALQRDWFREFRVRHGVADPQEAAEPAA